MQEKNFTKKVVVKFWGIASARQNRLDLISVES
jgi:hypothetical protein